MKFVLFISLSLVQICVAEPLVVVASNKLNVPKLTQQDISRYFLREQQFWPNGEKVKLMVYSIAKESFIKDILQYPPVKYYNHVLSLKQSKGIKEAQEYKTEDTIVSILSVEPNGLGVITEKFFDALDSDRKDSIKVVYQQR